MSANDGLLKTVAANKPIKQNDDVASYESIITDTKLPTYINIALADNPTPYDSWTLLATHSPPYTCPSFSTHLHGPYGHIR